MASFRILDQFPVFFDNAGNVAAGGALKFYQSGTTTPQDVYGDPALSVNNGSVLTLGSDGRPSADIWGSGTYRVRLYAADGTLIAEKDDVELPGGAGTTIPALVSGKFLTNDGATLQWDSIEQVPDPTGQANKVLSTDGTNLIWIDKPTNGSSGANANVTVGASSLKVGLATGDLSLFQAGSSSAPASGSHTTSVSVTFPTAFKSVVAVIVTPTGSGYATAGYLAIASVTTKSTTGFTVAFNSNSSDGSNGSFINPVPFDWFAFGTVAS